MQNVKSSRSKLVSTAALKSPPLKSPSLLVAQPSIIKLIKEPMLTYNYQIG